MENIASNNTLNAGEGNFNEYKICRTGNVNLDNTDNIDFALFCYYVYFYIQRNQRKDEVAVFFNEVISYMNTSILLKHKQSEDFRKVRSNVIFYKFINCINSHCPFEHCISFYASKLCLTPKYLSKIAKDISGKTAGDWITEFIVLEAKTLLRNTNLTIQEVSDRLNFSNQSSFGKFFKKNVGISPRKFAKDSIKEHR